MRFPRAVTIDPAGHAFEDRDKVAIRFGGLRRQSLKQHLVPVVPNARLRALEHAVQHPLRVVRPEAGTAVESYSPVDTRARSHLVVNRNTGSVVERGVVRVTRGAIGVPAKPARPDATEP